MRSITLRVVVAAVTAAWLSSSLHPVAAASLDTAVQQRIRAATFEVVQLKPGDGALQYEKPLPLDLLPYQERNDRYRSIGTAFAIGPNRYVTAAHVMNVGMGSQFGPPALRDAAGNVYAVDSVLKFSDREDFVVFSLREEPKGVQPLTVGTDAKVNDSVFTVGNALGQGIVFRDGVYTSDTPEELNGEWQWLRFSAAASPGNSGGPLIDQAGKLIGVVLRKSEAENLNYALPIARVVAAQNIGKMQSRTVMRLSLTAASEPMSVDEQFTLPLPLPEYYQTLAAIVERHFTATHTLLVQHNAANLFPNGNGSSEMLHRSFASPLPRSLRQGQDGVWVLNEPKTSSFELEHNGFLRIAGGVVRLRAPDDVDLTRLYSDSKLLMDLVLRGMVLRRQVGAESVRITSLGAAEDGGSYTDHYGRVWRVMSWKVPFDDLVLSALCMPTPEGYALVIAPTPTGYRGLFLQQQKFLADYLYVTMLGSLARWRDYMTHRELLPQVLQDVKLELDPAHPIRYQSRRIEFEVKPDVVKLNDDSPLEVQFSFFRSGDAVVWDVSQVTFVESLQRPDTASVLRIAAPDSSLPQNFQSAWNQIQTGQYPFDAHVFANSARPGVAANSEIRTTANAERGKAQASSVRYVLTVQWEGQQAQGMMAKKLKLLQRSVKPLE